MTETRLQEIKERLQAWADAGNMDRYSEADPVGDFQEHAPEDIADLLAEVDRLKAIISRLTVRADNFSE